MWRILSALIRNRNLILVQTMVNIVNTMEVSRVHTGQTAYAHAAILRLLLSIFTEL